MRIIIVILICAVSTLTFTACNDQQYFSNEDIANINIEEEMKNLEELYDAIGGFAEGMGIDLHLPDLNDLRNEFPVEEDNSAFDKFPTEYFMDDIKPGRNKLTGKLFYIDGFAMENEGWDGSTVISILILEDFGDVYHDMRIHVPDESEGWETEIDLGKNHTFYFQYVGFSEDYNRHLGVYIKHTQLDW